MAKDEPIFGAHGIGKWDAKSTRYIPIGGGSRSRLALNIKNIPPYEGFAGLNLSVTNEIDNMASLFELIGGGAADTNYNETRRSEQDRKSEAPGEPIEAPIYFGTSIQMPVEAAPPVQEPMEAKPPVQEPQPLPPLTGEPEHLGTLTEELADLRTAAPVPEQPSEPAPEPEKPAEPEAEQWGEPIMDADGFL